MRSHDVGVMEFYPWGNLVILPHSELEDIWKEAEFEKREMEIDYRNL